jgi:glycosyltransferase involved in cell wall biosynthesis
MKVFLTLWGDPSGYLALMSSEKLLFQEGISIDVVYRKPNPDGRPAQDLDFEANTRLHCCGKGRTGFWDKLDYLWYIFYLINLARKEKPDVVIGYMKLGLMASYLMTVFCPKTKLVYHNFDFDSADYSSFRGKFELYIARRAEMTIFPTVGRAEEYKELANLVVEPIGVMNCYSLGFSFERTGEFQRILDKRGHKFDKIVVRLGMMGPFHAIESTIRSVSKWDGNWGLVLGGFVSDVYLAKLHQLINELDLDRKIIVLPNITQGLWNDILVSSDLGICLYESWNLSHDHMAGTSQKLNGYFVAGIPSVVPDNEDFRAMVAQYGTSKTCDVGDPNSIALAVNSLLSDPDEYSKYRENVLKAFQTEFNYEKQFQPVLRFLGSE